MAAQPATMLAADAVVNGPEDEPLDWHAISWWAAEEDVRRLRQRIFTGLLEPDARKACKSGSEGGRAQQCARPNRQDGDLGYFGVGDQALFVLVPDGIR